MKGVSIIICTFNGSNRIGKALDSIISQVTSVSRELIIVDNASTDDTGLFCEKYLTNKNVGFPWKILYEKKPGLSSARMCGLRECFFDFILFCDDDNYLCADYIQTGYEIMISNQCIGVLGGNGYPLFEQNPPEWFFKFSHSYAVGAQSSSSGKIHKSPSWVYGAGSFFEKGVLNYLFKEKRVETVLSGRKGSSLSSGDDVEWCFLVQMAGMEIWYEEKLRFGHLIPSPRLTWSYYLRLKKEISLGSARLFSYSRFFNGKQKGLLLFLINYFLEGFKYHLLSIKYFFAIRNQSPELELSRVILASKAASFRKEFFPALLHYRKLARMF